MAPEDDEFIVGFSSPAGPDPVAQALKRQVIEMVMWHEHQSPRSQQVAIGPSELGVECDRRIAYRLAGVPKLNDFTDPWPAVVGSAIHNWMETMINKYQGTHGDQGWRTEMNVYPDALVRGRSDVYNYKTSMIVDWKSTGPEVMRKVKKGQIPIGYIRQIQLYGLGHEKAGREVKSVALVFLPRSGWIEDLYVHLEPYDRSVATETLDRMYRIGNQLLDLDIEQNLHRFEQIEATPGDSCTWCAYFKRDLDPSVAATDKGCPGR